MREIDCLKCKQLINTVEGCKKYGPDPKVAAQQCAEDGFKYYRRVKEANEGPDDGN